VCAEATASLEIEELDGDGANDNALAGFREIDTQRQTDRERSGER
jgi:hypothetical protein